MLPDDADATILERLRGGGSKNRRPMQHPPPADDIPAGIIPAGLLGKVRRP
jgi:hypothetical protein